MTFRLRNPCLSRPLARRSVGAILLLAYTFTAAGFPMPTKAPSGKAAELFPCANNGCGCSSADSCWRSCCCHTLAERLQWAHRHGVRPPAFAIAQAVRAGIDVNCLAKDSGQRQTCCSKDAQLKQKTCCESKPAGKSPAAARTCCADKSPPPSNAPTRSHVVAWQTFKCRGQSMNWLAAVPTQNVERPAFSYQLPFVAWIVPASSDDVESPSYAPASPPPEMA